MVIRMITISLLFLLVGVGVYFGISTPRFDSPQTRQQMTLAELPQTTTQSTSTLVQLSSVRGFVYEIQEVGDVLQLGIEPTDGTRAVVWYPLASSVDLQIYERSPDGSYATTPDHGPHFDESMTLQSFRDLVYRTSSPYTLEVILSLDTSGKILTISEQPTEQ